MTTQYMFFRCNRCYGFLVTAIVDEGEIPVNIACNVTQGCKGRMKAGAISDPTKWPSTVPWDVQAVWCVPPASDMQELKKNSPMSYNHALKGGLLLRLPKDGETFTLPPRVPYGG